jgi:murein DD-endopeptidase MepM/ murein hydrolase activator NlpD
MRLLLISLFALLVQTAFCQSDNSPEFGGVYPLQLNSEAVPCITPDQYTELEKSTQENLNRLNISTNRTAVTLFSWPLRLASGLNDCSYYGITNYLDQDNTSGLLDWNCGSVTYNGHKGTDICSWPYPFLKMDSNSVDVIAAAPGTILNKVDGNFDKNCVTNSSTPNYISILHADGSVAHYYHMKKNSLTSKSVGQSVATGEFLGIVGSSGNSTAPHLHFEVWSGSSVSTLKDSYAGTCNSLNTTSWWANQKPYTEPLVIHASVNSSAPVMPACPTTETPNEDTCFSSGASANFVIFIRNETPGTTVNMRIVRPNGNTFSSWTHTCTGSYLLTYWYWIKSLPTQAGNYVFEAVYNGDTCRYNFKVNCFVGLNSLDINNSFSIAPNPFNETAVIKSTLDLADFQIRVFNLEGKLLFENSKLSGYEVVLDRTGIPSGMYFVQFYREGVLLGRSKFIITDH